MSQRIMRAFQVVALLAGLQACGGQHVRMVMPDTSIGSSYRCRPSAECRPSEKLVPEEANQQGTAFIVVPRTCGGRIDQLFVLQTDPANPKVAISCPADASGAPTEQRYVCQYTSKKCAAESTWQALIAGKSVAPYKLPEQCAGHINEILVLDADEPAPEVVVTCAPVEDEISVMGEESAPEAPPQ